MKISVIVPVGDRAQYGACRDALRRSLALATACEWELVEIFDDTRRGVSWARNEGLRRATGDYVAWVDADDSVREDWAGKICAAASRGVDVVTIDARLVGWKNHRHDLVWGEKHPTMEKLRVAVYRDWARWGAMWLYAIKRELWADIRFDEDVKVAEDYLVLPQVLARASSCAYVPEKLYEYKCNEGSIMNSVRQREFKDWLPPWERRMAEAPDQYKHLCRWEKAASCYWLCDWAAVDRSGAQAEGMGGKVLAACRDTIRRDFWWLVGEALRASDLGVWTRLCWLFRFTCAATGFWTVQKWRQRRGRRER